ncbi:MAG: YebC/PmpR family DNA-binding transcriptional regulator [Candidatus Portnoybacteria bacterium]|nr:YebC/PmpR family DNA-binding transcriptional regulator [Candidatus Portnoybacteria bacterium]
MSGHSKWSQIKHKKAITDAKKGKVFSKIARMISVAVREGGGDPNANYKLRMIIDKAKAVNMPSDNVERAVKKGTGALEGVGMEEFTYEAYGPGGIALIIEGITDNKNRALSEIKHLLSSQGGKFAETGSVSFLFQKKGVVIINNKEKKIDNEGLELKAIDAGAEDLKWQDENILEINTRPEDLEKIKTIFKQADIVIESSSLDWVPVTEISVEDEKTKNQIEKLMEALDECDDVNEIYSNYHE